jgi:hypothetical protein
MKHKYQNEQKKKRGDKLQRLVEDECPFGEFTY